METRQGYLAYLLRLWKVDGAEGPRWRGSLESPHSGQRRAFANIEALFAFLEAAMAARSRSEQLEGRAEGKGEGPSRATLADQEKESEN